MRLVSFHFYINDEHKHWTAEFPNGTPNRVIEEAFKSDVARELKMYWHDVGSGYEHEVELF